MNNANGGNIIFKFLGDSKDLEGKTSNLATKFKDVGSVISKTMIAGTAAASAAVIKFVKDATSSFAEFEQLQGGLEAMFKDNEAAITSITATSQQAYKDLQMSQNEYLQSFEGSYAIVKNGLGEEADAIEYTNKVLQLSSDLFNTYGGSTEQYSNAINWALKGTYSYLDNLNLGIKGTQEGFVEAANASGVLAREISDVKDLTNNEIIDVIQYYAESYGAWGRSAEEASKTVAGSLKMTKASWSDLVNEFGKENGDIEGAFDRFIESAEKLGENIMPLLERILTNVVEKLPGIVEKIAEYLPGLLERLLPVVIQAAVDILVGLTKALPSIISVLAGMLPTILKSLIEGATQIMNELANQMPVLIPILVDAIMEMIPVLIENAPMFLAAGVKLAWALLQGILNVVPQMIGNMIDTGKNLLSGLWDGIKDKKQWVLDKIKGLGDSIINAVKGIFGVHSPSTEFAFIGRMNVVGLEKGMEDLQPELEKTMNSLFSLNPSITGSMNNTLSPTINVVNNVDMKTDPLGQVVANIKTFSNGAKNDYNYGMGV